MTGKLLGRTVPVSGLDVDLGEEATVGAGAKNTIRILAPEVSDMHARIWFEGGRMWLEDAGSSAGTFLNGDRIVHRELLHHLDVITFGGHVDLIYVTREAKVPDDRITAAFAELTGGTSAGTRIEVPKGELTFGRGSSCDVVLPFPSVSRAHARLQRTPNQIVLQDLESANGTFVNGDRIEGPTELENGDVVRLGGHQGFTMTITSRDEAAGQPSGGARTANALPSGPTTRIKFEPWEIEALNAAAAKAKARVEHETPSPEQKTEPIPRPRPGPKP